uniref:Calcium-transporting ATPase n=1 Tax=Syphacia muris TaxID=451379 RepID=A0A0N5A822_9BILA
MFFKGLLGLFEFEAYQSHKITSDSKPSVSSHKVKKNPELFYSAFTTVNNDKNGDKVDCSVQQLRNLMETRGAEAVVKLSNEFNGVDGLCKRLQVNPLLGLPNDPQVLAKRRAKFGTNRLPPPHSKSFIRLLFDACKDPTLIILVVAGFISLGLSFVEPGQSNSEENPVSSSVMPYQEAFLPNTTAETLVKSNVTSDSVEESDQGTDHDTAWIEGTAILVCVIVVVLVTAINEYSKERQFRGLQADIQSGHTFSVIRGGEAIDVPVSELVVGDVARIKYGDLLPADGVLLQCYDLKMDESSLTGESDYICKSIKTDPILLSGTYAMEGSGKMLVTAVGVNSQAGIIMSLLNSGHLSTDSDSDSSSCMCSSSSSTESSEQSSISRLSDPLKPTSKDAISDESNDDDMNSCTHSLDDDDGLSAKSVLQAKLSRLALQIIYCGTTIAVIALLVLVIRFCIEEYIIRRQSFDIEDIQRFVKFFIIAVTILVISIPEGLPLAIALALTYSVRKMMHDHNLVRHLDACETMGNATTICSDKTGTLTTNHMTVVQYLDKHFETIETQPQKDEIYGPTASLLADAITINSSYNSKIKESSDAEEKTQQIGNKTECGLLGFVMNLGFDYNEIRKSHPEESLFKVYTFNSLRKSMMTVVRLVDSEEQIGFRVYQKGAAEIVLDRCNAIVGKSGEFRKLDSVERRKIRTSIIEPMTEFGLRTICIAYKDYINTSVRKANLFQESYNNNCEVNWEDEKQVSSNMVMIAVCGIQDPVRPEVPAAIEKCKLAGITVRMVTGDNINTARAIAMASKILEPGEDFLALEGKEFNERIRDSNGKISQEKLDQIWPRLRVLARARPADKYTLVKGIIQSKITANREIVAVTGDGTNDGPALKKADVGFAMGIAGTDVAKEASDIILTDDNFTSIVQAVKWGRNVYDSISKFLQFQLTVNVVAVLTSFVSACTISDSPLKAVHMLWINLIMDTLASLALATEMPTEELLNRKPYGRKKSLISRTMLKNIGCHAVYQMIILFTIIYLGSLIFGIRSGINAPLHAPPSQHFTIVFNAFVMMTLFNEFNSRKVHGERNVFKGLLGNRIFCVIWLATFIGQICIVQYGGEWFSTAPLNAVQWIICLAIGMSSLIWGQIVTTIPSKRLPKNLAYGRDVVAPIPILSNDNSRMDENMSLSTLSYRTGTQLWARGAALFALHFRVIRAFQEMLERNNMFRMHMPPSSSERWRKSYRLYQNRKSLLFIYCHIFAK